MAPTRQRKLRKSTESQSSVDTSGFPAPPQTIPTIISTPTRTPLSKSPIKKVSIGLTANQKQALLDNLQLEITERARKLRAQYMLQAQGLRTRIEIRVNRIPMALRKAKMGDLFLKYNETAAKSHATNAILPGMAARGRNVGSPARNLIQENQRNTRNSPSPMRPPKRRSVEMLDKENDEISNPKRRVKTAPASRAVSRTKQADHVLSPRSPNSRSLPQARPPTRPPTSMASPVKSYLARPASPMKAVPPMSAGGAAGMLTSMVEKAKSTRATGARKAMPTSTAATSAAGRTRKQTTVPPPVSRARRGRGSNSSDASDTSVRTTIVTKPTATKKEPVKRTVMGTVKGGTKKTVAAAATPKPAPAGRVLRRRGAV